MSTYYMTMSNEDHIVEFQNLHIGDGDNNSTDVIGSEISVFDQVIGHIEDIIMDEHFQEMQTNFMEKYYKEFDYSEENKLVYMDIFKEYTDVIEKYIEEKLHSVTPDFDMANFVQQITEHKSDLEGEVFEILLTFTDFLIFKEMFLDYKAVKEGKVEDLSSNIIVTSIRH